MSMEFLPRQVFPFIHIHPPHPSPPPFFFSPTCQKKKKKNCFAGVTDLKGVSIPSQLKFPFYEKSVYKAFLTFTFLSQIVTPIVTALHSSSTLTHSSSRTSIIAFSAVAVIAILILALATLFCLRIRRRRRKRSFRISRPKLRSRSSFLAGEDIGLPTRSPPPPPMRQSDPYATYRSNRIGSATSSVFSDGPRQSFSRSQSPSSRTRINVYDISAPLPAPSTSPTPAHLLRSRAEESGSIFQESVWPPPSAASQLMDPLTYPSQSVDLSRAVMDVMSPSESSTMLLLQPNPSSQMLGQGQGEEQGQGALYPYGEGEGEGEGEDERRGVMIPSSTIDLTNPDNCSPLSDFQSSPSLSPPPIPPRSLLRPRPGLQSGSESELPPRPPSTPWLSRPLNSSPRGSPMQRLLPF